MAVPFNFVAVKAANKDALVVVLFKFAAAMVASKDVGGCTILQQ